MVPNQMTPGLMSIVLFFFSACLQPLCYVVTFPTGSFNLVSVLLATFCSPSPNSIAPAPALAPSPLPTSSPAPDPDNHVSSCCVITPHPTPSHNLSSVKNPSSSPFILSPSLLSLPVQSSTAIFCASTQECHLPGACHH